MRIQKFQKLKIQQLEMEGRGKIFLTLSRIARDVLAIQASSVDSKSAFSVKKFQIKDHNHSLAEDNLEFFCLIQRLNLSGRRNLGLQKLTIKEEGYSEILCTTSNDDMELMQHQATLPISEEILTFIIRQLERSYIGEYIYQHDNF